MQDTDNYRSYLLHMVFICSIYNNISYPMRIPQSATVETVQSSNNSGSSVRSSEEPRITSFLITQYFKEYDCLRSCIDKMYSAIGFDLDKLDSGGVPSQLLTNPLIMKRDLKNNLLVSSRVILDFFKMANFKFEIDSKISISEEMKCSLLDMIQKEYPVSYSDFSKLVIKYSLCALREARQRKLQEKQMDVSYDPQASDDMSEAMDISRTPDTINASSLNTPSASISRRYSGQSYSCGEESSDDNNSAPATPYSQYSKTTDRSVYDKGIFLKGIQGSDVYKLYNSDLEQFCNPFLDQLTKEKNQFRKAIRKGICCAGTGGLFVGAAIGALIVSMTTK